MFLADGWKRGIGVYWKNVEKEGYNPSKDRKTLVVRKELFVDYELPMKDEYSEFILNLIESKE
ncbi:tRNA(His)-5'-guanylyltransferase [Flammeovirgaceae bacterium 311]|nr:tRNA(His)-5'-guanylyltransferase [Flammeovirgaceae bacterium 311]